MRNRSSAAEVQKLAHSLGVPRERLAMLAEVPAEDLRWLRRQLAEALFQADRHHFVKVVAVSKLIPGALAAKITELALSPLIAARVAELIEPQRAVDLVHRISDSYLADVSAAMDAGRATEVIAQIPPDRIATVAAELARREEWVVIGGFVAHVSPEALRAGVQVLTGEQLLRIGFVLDDTDRLDDIAGMLTDQQLDQLRTAAVNQDLWVELDELISHLGDERVARIAARFTDDPATGEAARAAVERGVFREQTLGQLSRS